MEHIFVYIILILFGLCMGSFAGAIAWRLRARQIVQDKLRGEKIDNKEYKQLLPLAKAQPMKDRSRCLHCGHTLAWFDLIPLVSWLSTGGKCRYCRKSIGWLEPIVELAVAAFFLLSYVYWPGGIFGTITTVEFLLWLVAGVLLAILFVYDLKWYLLPNYVVFPLIGISVVVAVLHITTAVDVVPTLTDTLLSVVLLSGLYFVLWIVSKGEWIGFGDVKLGLALALFLGSWQLAFIALFVANLIGCLIVIPAMLAKKITRKTRVPFGPLLILGGVIAFIGGQYILNWYFVTLL